MNIWDIEVSALGCILYATTGATPESIHRVSLIPGQDVSDQPQQIIDLAAQTWTPAVIAAYAAAVGPRA